MTLYKKYKLWFDVPESATLDWYRKRGYALEKIIYEALKRDGLNPRSSYKIDGEQIDGSFILGDKVYLFEAKWHKKEMSASNMYEFKGKVDGKLVGTIGVFISISGYSKDSVTALIYGKEINVILFDGYDLDLALQEKGGFKRVLIEKLRAAAEEGTPMYSAKAIQQEAIEIGLKAQGFKSPETLSEIHDTNDFTIICEGITDKIVLSTLASRITDKQVTVIEAFGARNIPLVASRVLKYKRNNNKLILIADSDGDETRILNMLKEHIRSDDWEDVIINNSIEDWLCCNNDFKETTRSRITDKYEKYAKEVNIAELRKRMPSFDKFCSILKQ